MLLEEGAATNGAVSKVWTILPIGGTVAMGNVCIRDAPPGIDGMATVGGTCVFVLASMAWMAAGPRFLSSLMCSGPCDRGWMEDAAAAAAPCCGCMTGPGAVTHATCCAGREDSKDGVRAITEDAGTNGLLMTGRDDTGADFLWEERAAAGEHSDPAGAGLETGTLFATTGGIRPGAPNLDGNETRVGVHTGGGAKLPLVLAGNTAEPTQSVRVDRNEGVTVAAHATKG